MGDSWKDLNKWILAQHNGCFAVVYGQINNSRWLIRKQQGKICQNLAVHPDSLEVIGLLSSGDIHGILQAKSRVADQYGGNHFTVEDDKDIRIVGPGYDMLVAEALGAPCAPFLVVGVTIKVGGDFIMPCRPKGFGFQVRLDSLSRLRFVQDVVEEKPSNVVYLADRQ